MYCKFYFYTIMCIQSSVSQKCSKQWVQRPLRITIRNDDNQRYFNESGQCNLAGLSIISLLPTLSINKNQNASAIVIQLYSPASSIYFYFSLVKDHYKLLLDNFMRLVTLRAFWREFSGNFAKNSPHKGLYEDCMNKSRYCYHF